MINDTARLADWLPAPSVMDQCGEIGREPARPTLVGTQTIEGKIDILNVDVRNYVYKHLI